MKVVDMNDALICFLLFFLHLYNLYDNAKGVGKLFFKEFSLVSLSHFFVFFKKLSKDMNFCFMGVQAAALEELNRNMGCINAHFDSCLRGEGYRADAPWVCGVWGSPRGP